MSDAPDTTLEVLLRIEGRLAELRNDMLDVKERLDAIEGMLITRAAQKAPPLP